MSIRNITILTTITIIIVLGLYLGKSESGNSFLKDRIPDGVDLSSLTSGSLPRSTGVAAAISKSTEEIPEGFIKYTNTKYSFSFYHSPEAKITEYIQGEGAMIITLENEKKVVGMQIFILPYWEKEITEKRFEMDVPSKIRTNVKATTLDGVEAVTFNSFDENLGATREVWTIRGGYLYEITTFQGVGDWFIPKMQTWKFI